jgi:hypothetical protein
MWLSNTHLYTGAVFFGFGEVDPVPLLRKTNTWFPFYFEEFQVKMKFKFDCLRDCYSGAYLCCLKVILCLWL